MLCETAQTLCFRYPNTLNCRLWLKIFSMVVSKAKKSSLKIGCGIIPLVWYDTYFAPIIAFCGGNDFSSSEKKWRTGQLYTEIHTFVWKSCCLLQGKTKWQRVSATEYRQCNGGIKTKLMNGVSPITTNLEMGSMNNWSLFWHFKMFKTIKITN